MGILDVLPGGNAEGRGGQKFVHLGTLGRQLLPPRTFLQCPWGLLLLPARRAMASLDGGPAWGCVSRGCGLVCGRSCGGGVGLLVAHPCAVRLGGRLGQAETDGYPDRLALLLRAVVVGVQCRGLRSIRLGVPPVSELQRVRRDVRM